MICSKCGEEIEIGARFCGHCGEPVETSVKYCPMCGTAVAQDAKYCGKCDYEFDADPEPQPEPPPIPQPIKKASYSFDTPLVLMIIGILSTCAGIGGFIANARTMGLAGWSASLYIMSETEASLGEKAVIIFAVYRWIFLIVGIALIIISNQIKKKSKRKE